MSAPGAERALWRAAIPNESVELEPGSYRDRNGAVFYADGAVYRGISAEALANFERLGSTLFFPELVARGKIIATERESSTSKLAEGSAWAALLRHERVPFVSYPYEWPFGMLKDAALLHLQLMLAALNEGMILKDSSAYNIQWNGAEPVFIDIPSFEVLSRGEPWIGYRQFCELFLYPLMLQAYKGVDFRPWLRGNIDGIRADTMRALLSARDVIRPGVLLHVLAQAALQRRYSAGGNVRDSLAKAGFDKRLIVRNVENLRKIVTGLRPGGGKTVWADYAKSHSYDAEEFEAKRNFVARAVATRGWRLAWDIGSNTGTFSRIAAEHAQSVVAMDGDWMAVEQLYQAQRGQPDARKILPLVVNVADAPPGQGWRGLERKSLPDRGKPDLTLCLALLHHIVIGANIPMREFVQWLASLGTSLIIEFVSRDDEMVQTLLANKDDQYSDYTPEIFEALVGAHFDIRDKQPLKAGKRIIYFATARR